MTTRARWIRIVLAVIALVAIAAPATSAKPGKKRGHAKQHHALTVPKLPLVIGHRGASGYYPEHTLQSYALAIRLGADYIEPDLVSTKDGVLIARHEPNIGGTTNVADHPEFASRKTTRMVDGAEVNDWFAADFTLAEIKTLRAKQSRPPRSTEFDGKFQIPTFQEVIDLAKRASKRSGRQVGIYPETKHPTFHQDLGLPLEGKLVKALKRNGLNRRNAPVFIQSFEQANLKQLNRMTKVNLVQLVDAWDTNPDGSMVYAETSLRPYDWTAATPQRTDTYGFLVTDAGLAEVKTYADGIGPWKPHIVPQNSDGSVIFPPTDLIQRAHAHGLLIHTWTFRDDSFPSAYPSEIAELRKFYELGIDGVFSDFPDTAVIARDFFWNS
jgi:glycerophosphoryl diester phosphodiesterase